jgi:hypothetical protein
MANNQFHSALDAIASVIGCKLRRIILGHFINNRTGFYLDSVPLPFIKDDKESRHDDPSYDG